MLCSRTPALLVENASLPNERQFNTRLDLLSLSTKSALGKGPALMLIGDAVRQNVKKPAQALRVEAY